MTRITKYIAGGTAVVAVAVVIAAARRGGARHPAAPAADSTRAYVLGATDVARATRADLTAGVPVSGTLEPNVQVRISAPIAEVLDQVLVKEGQAVARGQVLARFKTAAVGPAAASAEAQRKLAQSDYDRMQNLYKEGAVSEHDLEASEVALRQAEATAAAAAQKAEEAVVRAPVTGVISVRSVESGDRVKDGDQLFQLVNIDALEFEATVPSEFAPQVHAGDAVALRVTGLPGATVAGRIARINAAADPATRQVKIYVSVPNPGHRLVAGLFAAGRVTLRQVRGAVAVPLAAVRSDSAGTRYVLTVEGGRVARHAVVTGAEDDQAGLVEVVQGLAGGETVIVGPAQGLAPGDAVTLARGEG